MLQIIEWRVDWMLRLSIGNAGSNLWIIVIAQTPTASEMSRRRLRVILAYD